MDRYWISCLLAEPSCAVQSFGSCDIIIQLLDYWTIHYTKNPPKTQNNWRVAKSRPAVKLNIHLDRFFSLCIFYEHKSWALIYLSVFGFFSLWGFSTNTSQPLVASKSVLSLLSDEAATVCSATCRQRFEASNGRMGRVWTTSAAGSGQYFLFPRMVSHTKLASIVVDTINTLFRFRARNLRTGIFFFSFPVTRNFWTRLLSTLVFVYQVLAV